jgi:hypothetical protein
MICLRFIMSFYLEKYAKLNLIIKSKYNTVIDIPLSVKPIVLYFIKIYILHSYRKYMLVL